MLTVVSSPTEGGSIEVSPEKTEYYAEDDITLTAVNADGYIFVGWTGEVEGIADPSHNSVTFTMGDNPDDKRSITANFALLDTYYTLTTILEPGSSGSVEVDPSPTSDGYPVNQSVSLSAVAQPGYIFSYWTGDLSGSENPKTLLMNNNKLVTAIFNVTVTTYCSPAEGGSVILDPVQTTAGYTAGTEVTISAQATTGYRFVSWGGDISSSDSLIEVTADAPKSITAKFEKVSPPSSSSSLWWVWVIVGIVGFVGLFIVLILWRIASRT